MNRLDVFNDNLILILPVFLIHQGFKISAWGGFFFSSWRQKQPFSSLDGSGGFW